MNVDFPSRSKFHLTARTVMYYKYMTCMLASLVCILAVIANPPVYQIFTMTIPEEVMNDLDSINFSGFTALPILVLIFNYLVTGFLGYGIIRHLCVDVSVSQITKVFAGFLFGYVGILALARIYSLYLSGMSFYLAVVFSAVAAGYYMLQKKHPPSMKIVDGSDSWHRWFVVAPLILMMGVVFVLAVLCLQVVQGECIFVGHGTFQYAYLLQDWVKQGMKHFPIIYQHYDELLFHYWATLFFIPDFNPIIPWWFTLSLIKLSIFGFIYIAFRKLGVRSGLAFVMSLFFMIGTSSPLINKYFLLFDGSNPLFFTLHSGRIVGVGVVIFILLEFLFAKKSREHNKSELMSLLFLGIGIVTTSLSNGVWALFMAVILCFIKGESPLTGSTIERCFEYKHIKSALLVVPMMVVLLLLMQPFTPTPIPSSLVYIRLILCLVYVGVCISALYQYSQTMQINANWINNNNKLTCFILVTLAALFLLGNLPGMILYERFPALIQLFPHEIKPQTLRSADLLTDVPWQWSTLISDHRESGTWLYTTVFDFAAYYGIFLLSCLGLNALVVRRTLKHELVSARDRILFYIVICVLACIPFVFFFINYVGFSNRAWVKTRFLELPVYIILFIGFYFAHRFLHKREKWVLICALLLYCIVPFIITQRPQRIWVNAQTLFETQARDHSLRSFTDPHLAQRNNEKQY